MKAVNEVYKYLSGNEYSDKVNGMAYQLLTLAGDLKSEIHTHHQLWKKRYTTYNALYLDLGTIDAKLRGLLAPGDKKETLELSPPRRQAYPSIEELEKK